MEQGRSGRETMQDICDQLRRKTLEPAKEEAKEIIAKAEERAEEIRHCARQEAKRLIEESHQKIEQQKAVFHTSLTQATNQAVEALKQTIQHQFFKEELAVQVKKEMSRPEVIRDVIEGLIQGLKEEGTEAPFSAIIAKTASPDEINALLAKEILDQLEGKSVSIGSFGGGCLLRVENKRMSLDMTDETIRELLQRYLHKDFRKWLFQDETAPK